MVLQYLKYLIKTKSKKESAYPVFKRVRNTAWNLSETVAEAEGNIKAKIDFIYQVYLTMKQ